MSWFSNNELNSLEDLFFDQMEDLYDAEQRLVEALPKMAEAANQPDLKRAFQTHLRETQQQVARLERMFDTLGRSPAVKICQAMKGLVAEGQEAIDAKGVPDVKDAALIAAAQRVEHYEIAAYGTARAFAKRLGRNNIVQLIEQTLAEEKKADQKLNEIAESEVNAHAAAV